MTNFVNWPRARPTLDFRISLTIGTSSVAASGMRNNDVTNFLFKGLRYAQPRIILVIPVALRAPSNPRSGSYSSLHSPYGLIPIVVTPRRFRYAQSATGNDFFIILTIGVSVANGMRNVSLTSWTILFCTIPHVREGAQVRVHTWGVILKEKTLVE